MNSNLIIWPVLAQIFLTLIMFIILGVRKSKAVKAGEVNRKQTALNNREWPDYVVKVSNNIANQFEAPILFYVLSLVLYSIDAVGIVAIILAWLFTLSRFAHAYVHIGTNYVPMRLRLFLIGCFVLIAMLIQVAWELAS
ncbi:MAPEG family protein [Pseudomonas sp. HK3]